MADSLLSTLYRAPPPPPGRHSLPSARRRPAPLQLLSGNFFWHLWDYICRTMTVDMDHENHLLYISSGHSRRAGRAGWGALQSGPPHPTPSPHPHPTPPYTHPTPHPTTPALAPLTHHTHLHTHFPTPHLTHLTASPIRTGQGGHQTDSPAWTPLCRASPLLTCTPHLPLWHACPRGACCMPPLCTSDRTTYLG